LRWIGGPDFVARAFHVMVALEGGLIPARGPWRHQRVRPCDPEKLWAKLQLMSWIR
jgi:hypothetical protein